MSCNSSCQTNLGGNIGIEFLSAATIQWYGNKNSEIEIKDRNAQIILSIGNATAKFTGPTDKTRGDGFLSIDLQESTRGLSICKPITCTDCNGNIISTYACCGDGVDCAPCGNSCDNPCDNPCDNSSDNPCSNQVYPQYNRNMIDPIYAYLESNPYNVMYPTGLVPFNQSLNNPLTFPTPYYKRYNSCFPCIKTPEKITLVVTLPGSFTLIGDDRSTNNAMGSGTCNIDLPRTATTKATEIVINRLGVVLENNIIQIDYVVVNKNGVLTWLIYGGAIYFTFAKSKENIIISGGLGGTRGLGGSQNFEQLLLSLNN
jgi:hypothetical protein